MHRAYAGGRGRDGVVLFLAVNEYQAARWRRGYPHATVQVVGCPKLDAFPREEGPRTGPVCVSFHWPGQVCPEAGTAWPHYRDAVRALADRGDVIGHAHPRMAEVVRPQLEGWGIPFVDDFDEVLTTAAVYVNDCSSTLYEFAACGGPVVVLNAPHFRRGVQHGLRFWEYADVGVQVNEPDQLPAGVALALEDPPVIAARRREVVRAVYPVEHAAEAAARHILAL